MALQDLLDKEIQKNLSKDEKNFYGLDVAIEQESQKAQSDFSRQALKIIQATISNGDRISLDEIDLRIKRLSNLKKYLAKANVGDTEEKIVSDAIEKAEQALTKQRKWKKSIFNRANDSISRSTIDMGALLVAMSGGDPLLGLGVKLVGDMLRARKERKMESSQQEKQTLREDAESLTPATSESPTEIPQPLDDNFGGPLVRDNSTGGGFDGRVVNLLQDIFLFTEEISDDVKLLVKEVQTQGKLTKSTTLDEIEAAREAGKTGLLTRDKGGKEKSGGGMMGKWKTILDLVQSVVLGGLSFGGAVLSKLKPFGVVGMLGGGLIWAAIDGIMGYFKASEWGVSGWAAAIGGFFGGTIENTVLRTVSNMGKWALIGAGLGSVFPVVGTLIGVLIGAALGGVMGYFGGEKIAKFTDNSVE